MNSNIVSEQVYIKNEDDPLSVIEIKTEPLVEDRNVNFVKLLENSKEFQDEQRNRNENKTDNVFVVNKPYETSEIYIKEEKFAINDHVEETSYSHSVFDNSLFEQNNLTNNTFTQTQNDICDKSFSCEKGGTLCVQSVEKDSVCDIYKPDSSKHSLHERTRIFSDKKPYKCDFCNKCFAEKKNLVLHMYIHTGERNFQCNICNKLFSRKFHLSRHMRTHSGEKPFKCEFCDKSFTTTKNLIVHMHAHIEKSCDIPELDCSQNDQCEYKRTQTGEKPYICDFCSTCFAEKKNLVLHMYIHTGERNFRCNICSKSFSRRFHLNRHMRGHSGEKPFQCEFCGKSFSEKSNMIVHMHTHTEEKSCNICNKTFLRKLDLYQHLSIHSSEKPFACNFCNESFSDKHYLAAHTCTYKVDNIV